MTEEAVLLGLLLDNGRGFLAGAGAEEAVLLGRLLDHRLGLVAGEERHIDRGDVGG